MRKAKRDGRMEAEIWERVTRFNRIPSPTAARALLTLQFPAEDRDRMRYLSAKARAGTLTPDEEVEADAYEQLGSLLGILHSQARQALKRERTAS